VLKAKVSHLHEKSNTWTSTHDMNNILNEIASLKYLWSTQMGWDYEQHNVVIPRGLYPPRNEDLSLPSRLSFRCRFCDCPYPASRPSLLYCSTKRRDSASGISVYDTSLNMSPTSGSMKLAVTAKLHHSASLQWFPNTVPWILDVYNHWLMEYKKYASGHISNIRNVRSTT